MLLAECKLLHLCHIRHTFLKHKPTELSLTEAVLISAYRLLLTSQLTGSHQPAPLTNNCGLICYEGVERRMKEFLENEMERVASNGRFVDSLELREYLGRRMRIRGEIEKEIRELAVRDLGDAWRAIYMRYLVHVYVDSNPVLGRLYLAQQLNQKEQQSDQLQVD